MNCDEVKHLAGDALDRQLPGGVLSDFYAHLKACIQCRTDYEIELIAKKLLRKHVPRVATPAAVAQPILRALRSEGEGVLVDRFSLFSGRWRFLTPVIAAAAVILIVLVFSFPPASSGDRFAHTAKNDVINQSLNNFSLVRSGHLRPSTIACYPDFIVGYFERQGVEFAVSVLSDDDSCDWYGALANSYDGVKIAHMVYKRGDDLLYVYEVRKSDVLNGSALSLPPAAKESLASTGWYTDPQHEGCNVVLWTVDETLCAAVSTMKKDRLLALLTTQ